MDLIIVVLLVAVSIQLGSGIIKKGDIMRKPNPTFEMFDYCPEKIRIAYWHGSKLKDLYLEHNDEYNYSYDNFHMIIQDVVSKGLNVMIVNSTPNVIIYIDDGRFRQK